MRNETLRGFLTQPHAVFAAQVLPRHGGHTAVAGITTELLLVTVDSQGIGLVAGGAVVTARVWGGPAFVPASVFDHSNGTLSVQFRLQVQGSYMV